MIFSDVFPLVQGSKKPAVKWSEPWAGTIAEGQGYGVPTGPRNGVWVLDLDRKGGVDGLASLQEYAQSIGGELPETLTARTPSGGLHLFFAWDDARPVGNRAGILPGIDVRGRGGYVCAGPGYDVIVDAQAAEAPEWLYDFVGLVEESSAEAAPAYAIGPEHPEWSRRINSASDFLKRADRCVSGSGGQKQLWEIALRLSRTFELPAEVSWELFDAETGYNARCVPPWEKWEAVRAFARAASEGRGPTGTFAANSPLLTDGKSAGAAPDGVTLRDANEPWRKRPDPSHEYSIQLAIDVSGGINKMIPHSQKEIAAAIMGPGAHPIWRGVWQYDRFRRRNIAVNPPFSLDAETIGLTEDDLYKIQLWYACTGVKASIESIRAAISVAAHAAAFHPVEDYLESAQEKVPTDLKSAGEYFDGIAGRLWGASPERDALESGHLRRLAIAAVRRVRRPGTKVDTMLVLQGEQGHHKSRFCAMLFGDYFRDQMPDLASKDASIAIEGYWGIEFAEFASFKRSEENTKKEFLTRCTDKYRPVWAASTLETLRECVFIGTTNDDDFLRDPTGWRRYDVCEVQRKIDLEGFDRDAFWSAACALEASGERHYVDIGQAPAGGKSAGAATDSGRHEFEDSWTDAVLRYVRTVTTEYVTAADALTYGVPVALEKQREHELTRVKAILRRHLGPSKVRWIAERAQRAYLVPSAAG